MPYLYIDYMLLLGMDWWNLASALHLQVAIAHLHAHSTVFLSTGSCSYHVMVVSDALLGGTTHGGNRVASLVDSSRVLCLRDANEVGGLIKDWIIDCELDVSWRQIVVDNVVAVQVDGWRGHEHLHLR